MTSKTTALSLLLGLIIGIASIEEAVGGSYGYSSFIEGFFKRLHYGYDNWWNLITFPAISYLTCSLLTEILSHSKNEQ